MSFNKRWIVASAALVGALLWVPPEACADSGARTARTGKQGAAKVTRRGSESQPSLARTTGVGTKLDARTGSISLLSSGTTDQITIPTSSTTPRYTIQKLEAPPRLVLDIESEEISGTGITGSQSSDRISRIRLGRHSNKSRVVLDLSGTDQLTHSAEVKEGRIILSVTSAGKPGAPSSQLSQETPPHNGIVKTSSAQVTRVSTQTQATQAPKASALRLDEEVVKTGGSASPSVVEPKLPADDEASGPAPSVQQGVRAVDTAARVVEVATSASNPEVPEIKAPKTLVRNVSLDHNSSDKPAVVVALDGDAEFGMSRTAPSEYVLTLKNAQAAKDLRKKTLFSSQDTGAIRSVRTVSAGDDTQVRIFIQPSSYLTTRKSGDKVFIEEAQDLAAIARDIRAQLDPSAVQTPAATAAPAVTPLQAVSVPAVPEKTPGKKRKAQAPEGTKPEANSTPSPDKSGANTAQAPEESQKTDVAKNPEIKQDEPQGKNAGDKDVAKPRAKNGTQELAGVNGNSASYTGRLISLDLQDADIDSALRIIAEVSNLNIVAGDGVTGKVTLKLVDVPWDQALDVILKSHGLDKVVEGNVMRVASVDKLQLERESLKKARVAGEELEDLNVKYMRVSYAKASEIKALVETVLSERGSVAFDERSNQLIVKDIRKGLQNVTELIKKIDLRTPQILLETQIVEASRNLTRELGSELGFQYIQSPATGNGTGLNFPSAIAVGGSVDPTTAGSITGSAFPAAGISPNLGSAITMLFDSADGTKSLSTRLTQLEQEGRVKIISKPAVATTNNKPAEIKSVEKYRVKLPNGGLAIATGSGANSNGSGDVATQTIEAGIVLNVTPQASPDYYILLDINAKSSSFGSKTVDGIPNEFERSASSSVLVSSGQTFALGGIYRIREKDDVAGVPFFKDIPVLGTFFRNQSTDGSDEELLFFITPRIVEGSFEDASSKVNS